MMQGRVVQVHRKPKLGRERGIPKQVVPALTLTLEGVEGDFNRWRTEKAGGDPDQAVLLLSDEILAELRAEGWPVQRGELGENLTMAELCSTRSHTSAWIAGPASFEPCKDAEAGSPACYRADSFNPT
jgi:MOSC domain-containing protein YiiM